PMGASGTIHRLSVVAMAMFAAAYVAFCALCDAGGGPNLPQSMAAFIYPDGGALIVWCLIIATTIAAFFLCRRNRASVPFFAAILMLIPIGWIGIHTLSSSRSLPNGEYWGYYLDLVMFRWMLAPWFAQYSVSLFIASLAVWAITRQ